MNASSLSFLALEATNFTLFAQKRRTVFFSSAKFQYSWQTCTGGDQEMAYTVNSMSHSKSNIRVWVKPKQKIVEYISDKGLEKWILDIIFKSLFSVGRITCLSDSAIVKSWGSEPRVPLNKTFSRPSFDFTPFQYNPINFVPLETIRFRFYFQTPIPGVGCKFDHVFRLVFPSCPWNYFGFIYYTVYTKVRAPTLFFA
jgi:hypothetical protein